MVGSEHDIDHSLTFAQREGVAPLPRQFALKQLPKDVRAPLWGLLYRELDQSRYQGHWLSGTWKIILHDYWIEGELNNADEFSSRFDRLTPWVKDIVITKPYTKTLGFFEFVIRHNLSSPIFTTQINNILTRTGSAYRVFGESIAPVASPEEAQVIARALVDTEEGGYAGARSHLQNAASFLTAGRYADAVRESMNAVESVARVLDPNSTTLAPALAALERKGQLHPAMKKGFQNLYGYTSDQQGIRHALLDERAAEVTEQEALYMFGSCASFASYLIRATRT